MCIQAHAARKAYFTAEGCLFIFKLFFSLLIEKRCLTAIGGFADMFSIFFMETLTCGSPCHFF